MRRGIEVGLDGPHADALAADGQGYARALLDRIFEGTAGPDELATLMQFVHAGPMLHAACAMLVLALRSAVRPARDGAGRAR